jgi:hypothetical protein
MRGLRASVGSSDIRVPIIEIRVQIIEIRVPIIEIRVPIIEVAGMRGLRASGGSSARPRKFSPRLPTAASTSRSHIGRSTQGAPPFALYVPLIRIIRTPIRIIGRKSKFASSIPLFALSIPFFELSLHFFASPIPLFALCAATRAAAASRSSPRHVSSLACAPHRAGTGYK